ncbi:DUF5776 domain-containing protein [Levilactobacillus lindianensis]|uniref:DUF5776 domain-containing protein n=1 Tax=Levilactobacillus lindianensis TaxID=2486018 RepID=UPI000F743995|nr:DUF5776 domain-containing protein [Levilactobacillus lindianensis]
MNRLIHKITISGLTLLLLSGVVSPGIAFADSSTSPVATAKTTEQTYNVQSIGLPYTLVSDKTGTHKIYWYAKWPASVTAKQANDPAFIQGLNDLYPEIPDISNFTGSFASMIVPVSLFPGETTIDYLVRSTGGDASSGADFIDSMTTSTYMSSWIIGNSARFKTGQLTREDFQANYENEFRPKMEKIDGTEGLIKSYDQIFATEDDDIFKSLISSMMSGMLLGTHLGTESDEQLATIKTDDSVRQMRAMLTAPMTNYLHLQADGTYELDGLILGEFQALSSWFVDVVTPDPDPDPNPATSQPVTVHYVDAKGKQVAPDKTLTGSLGSAYTTDALTIKSYKLSKTPANAKGTFTSQAQTVTYIYEPEIQTGGSGATVAPEGSAIYGLKKLALYKKTSFTKKNRITIYAKKSRQNRPMFVVTGYTKSASGAKRYKVRDVNHHSKTAGKTGYITAKKSVVAPVYYTKKTSKITVTNPSGINAYAKKNLTKKKAHYRQGQVLKVKKIVHHNLTTRFVLTNGRYVTANKKLVIAGKKTMPKKIVTKTAINRYRTANLTKRNRHYRKNTVLKVTGWTYSNANNFSKHDTLRYQISGGYVTGNSRYVRGIK